MAAINVHVKPIAKLLHTEMNFHAKQSIGCRPSGVELPATRGYVGTVSGDLPHSSQNVSVN